MNNTKWIVNKHKIFFDKFNNCYMSFVTMTDVYRADMKSGPNVKVPFKTRCEFFNDPNQNMEGKVVTIDNVWTNNETANVCLVQKTPDNKYQYAKAYITTLWFGSAKLADVTPSQPTPTPQPTNPNPEHQPTSTPSTFNWDEDL